MLYKKISFVQFSEEEIEIEILYEDEVDVNQFETDEINFTNQEVNNNINGYVTKVTF
jgi:hypothetical protein